MSTEKAGQLITTALSHSGLLQGELNVKFSDQLDQQKFSLSGDTATRWVATENSPAEPPSNLEEPGELIDVPNILSTFGLREVVNSITISDDLSHFDALEERQLLALRGYEARQASGRQLQQPYRTTLEEFQPKLMLLAQENQKRLMQARMTTKPVEPKHSKMQPRDIPAASGVKPSTPPNKRSLSQAFGTNSVNIDEADFQNMDMTELHGLIDRLQEHAKRLKASGPDIEPTVTWQILYRIWEDEKEPSGSGIKQSLSGPFFDKPRYLAGQNQTGKLECDLLVENIDLYLEQNKQISFIVYFTYYLRSKSQYRRPDTGEYSSSSTYHLANVSIRPIRHDLTEALNDLLGSKEEYAPLYHDFQRGPQELYAPFFFIFHERKNRQKIRDALSDSYWQHLSLFWDYALQNYGQEYEMADYLLSKSRMSSKYLRYLFKPGEIVVQRKGATYQGLCTSDWVKVIGRTEKKRREVSDMVKNGRVIPPYSATKAKRMNSESVLIEQYSVRVWHWEFDGSFHRKEFELQFCMLVEEEEEEEEEEAVGNYTKETNMSRLGKGKKASRRARTGVAISELEVFPIRYASPEVVSQLQRRGQTFWKNRNRGYVSYQEAEENIAEDRYMIDLKTYRSLHKDKHYSEPQTRSNSAPELGPEAMAKDKPPDSRFEILLPPTIKGFNFRRKKWIDLVADRVKEVKWNKEVFQQVVIDRKVKDLIQALVSNHIAADTSADLIEGKGNGLILLLHGSPGTGKTLTAESVAEIAEKPLYRVTCGDVGTKAEDVERYLESVLHLGKLWDCVVLLDEADVFLEQRSLEDLQRNALVSVFLRVLEYYEGILILTSNRVGTFDEAFKSRIQLALHYPTLGSYQRLRVWENFLQRLENVMDDSVDVADLRDHLDALKEEEMNGRQIRNAITTARQYAKWKNVPLTYKQLKEVIDISGRFDVYLKELHGGFSQDQLAQDQGLRRG